MFAVHGGASLMRLHVQPTHHPLVTTGPVDGLLCSRRGDAALANRSRRARASRGEGAAMEMRFVAGGSCRSPIHQPAYCSGEMVSSRRRACRALRARRRTCLRRIGAALTAARIRERGVAQGGGHSVDSKSALSGFDSRPARDRLRSLEDDARLAELRPGSKPVLPGEWRAPASSCALSPRRNGAVGVCSSLAAWEDTQRVELARARSARLRRARGRSSGSGPECLGFDSLTTCPPTACLGVLGVKTGGIRGQLDLRAVGALEMALVQSWADSRERPASRLDGAAVARRAHNPKVAGSNPARDPQTAGRDRHRVRAAWCRATAAYGRTSASDGYLFSQHLTGSFCAKKRARGASCSEPLRVAQGLPEVRSNLVAAAGRRDALVLSGFARGRGAAQAGKSYPK